jgi:hypothetical protein
MSWDGSVARPALAATLATAFEGTNVSVFAAPPSTINPPALVVQYPQTVVKWAPTFITDTATWSVMGAVGLEQSDELDSMLNTVAEAVRADPTLAGAVQVSKVTEIHNWRIVAVGGIEVLAAEVVLESRM